MGITHVQCQYCLCTVYFNDDKKDDENDYYNAWGDCGCQDNQERSDDYFDDDND